jgi:hypothetical protein
VWQYSVYLLYWYKSTNTEREARLARLAQHAETVSLLEATQEEAARKTKELEEELRVLKEQEKVEREQAFA